MNKSLISRRLPIRWLPIFLRHGCCVFLFLVPLIYLLFSSGMVLFIGGNSYEAVLRWYAAWQPEGFDVPTIAATCFTPHFYMKLRGFRWIILAALLTASGVYLFYGLRIWSFLQRWLDEVGAVLCSMAAVFRQLTGWQRMALLFLFVSIGAYRLYFFFSYPLQPDEVFSYLFCARQGWVVTVTNYVSTNNHILLNVFCSLLGKLSWLAPKAVMRLPSMIGDLLLLSGVFSFFYRRDGFKRAFAVVGGVAFCYYTSYYSVQGRGYELQILCALACALSGWRCFCGGERDSRKGYSSFIVVSIAGLYINPTFCYATTAAVLMCGYCLFRRREQGWLLARAVLVIGLGSLILYLPMLLSGGWGGLSQLTQSGEKGIGELVHRYKLVPLMIKDISYYGMTGLVFICLFSLLSIYLYRSGRLVGEFYDAAGLYLRSLAGALLVWTVYSRVYPYERALCFAIFLLYVLFVNICFDCWKLYVGRVTPWAIGCFLVIKVAGSVRSLYWPRYSSENRYEIQCYRMIEKDLDELDRWQPGIWQVGESDNFYPMYLRMHLLDHKSKARVVVNRDSAMGDVIFLPMQARGSYPMKGYSLWKLRILPGDGAEYTSTYIYVADKLFHSTDRF